MSYSQFDEERHILDAFSEGLKGGRFLDIGAWNAKTFSNTRALYELGWSGVMIEPSPVPMAALLEEYGDDSRIVLIQACASTVHELLSLHVTADAISTVSRSVFETWKAMTDYRQLIVPSITLAEIALRFGGFDFVNFDAEGISVDLMLHALALGWQPKCICVEHDDRQGEIIAVASQVHYYVTYGNGTNLVLVRQ